MALRNSKINPYAEINNPYVGPRPFQLKIEDQKRFFGRDVEAEEIITLIMGHQLVLIYAQSGVGKTSLFNAKIIPSLKLEKFVVLPMARVSGTSEIQNYNELSKIPNYYIFNSLQHL